MPLTSARTLRVTLDGQRDYDILIGRDLLRAAGDALQTRFGARRVFIIRDARVGPYASVLEDSLRNAGHSVHVLPHLPEGEAAKTWDALRATVDALLEARADRRSLIMALGGGVTGDHAGFAAAITLRGLDYIQIPTTLLAQVDSSVGGKTGINTAQGKNLIGAFYQPRLVLADTATLDSLPDRTLRAGYAEVVKYAFIRDPGFFDWLEDNVTAALARDHQALPHAIATSCAAKAAIVGADERETADRALLNFGHTFGHALEAACRYDDRLPHGEAVAVGMALAFEVSTRMGLCPEEDTQKAITHMARAGLPVRIADITGFPPLTPAAIVDLMAGDKKASGGRLTFILAKGIGRAFTTQEVDMTVVTDAIARSQEAR